MPLYSFHCSAGHELEFVVKFEDRDKMMFCPVHHENKESSPVCGEILTRKGIELNAKSFPGADSWRKK